MLSLRMMLYRPLVYKVENKRESARKQEFSLLGRTFEAVLVEGVRSETRTLGIVPTILSAVKPILILIDQIWNDKKARVLQDRAR